MTRARRRSLEARAYPDPFLLKRWRNRAAALAVVAVVMAAAGLVVVAVVPMAAAAMYGVRCFRREWALGALLGASQRPALPRPAREDLRAIYRRV